MELAGKVWNSLQADERMRLLRQCTTITSNSIKQMESQMKWQKLMPVTQRDLLSVDFSAILGRDVTP